MTDRLSAFTSEQARDTYYAKYDAALGRLWPAARPVDVPTRLGTVRAYRDGPDGDDPVVLLAGAGGNAASWHRYAGALAAHRPVVAIDPLGEVGRSVQTAAITDGADAAAWLTDVLAEVGAQRAHLVGSSYGGWLALEQQRHSPGRVSASTLLDPAGFAALSARFYRWIILGGLAAMLPTALRARAARRLVNGVLLDGELVTLGFAGRNFRRRLPAPPPFTDEQLAEVVAPVQLLLGARSAMHDSAAVAQRCRAVAPHWRVEIVPDTGHALPVEATELVIQRVLDFTPTRS